MAYQTLIYNRPLALLTDLYQITMAYGYWKNGMAARRAVFHLIFRENPFKGGFAIAAGLAYAVDLLKNFHFEKKDLEYLARLRGNDGKPVLEKAFLSYLKNLKLKCDVDAVPEGTAVFAPEPLVRVSGPLLQCQLLESVLLNIFNFQTLIATKAARVALAAQGAPVLEFGLRRAQGMDGALAASRAAYIGGCASTSNVLAGELFGIPVKGTQAHSWVMCFDQELEAFKNYAKALPNNSIFLVDTYDTLEGVQRAVEAGKILRQHGHQMIGVRLDSGNLLSLSKKAKKILEKGGFKRAKIIASGDLDEFRIDQLKKGRAPIHIWGVGTRLVTGFGQGALGGVYKLAAIEGAGGEWKYRIKLSDDPAKSSIPGILQARRYFDKKGFFQKDVIYDILKGISPKPKGRDLLVPVFRRGRQVYHLPSIGASRARALEALGKLKGAFKKISHPKIYPVILDPAILSLRRQLTSRAKAKKALVIVDLQNDFCPGGALPVKEGDRIIPLVNRLQKKFDWVVATQDWHPRGHKSFAGAHAGKKPGQVIKLRGLKQILWPDHCVQRTHGAAFVRTFDRRRVKKVFHKAMDRWVDSYSAFFDNGHRRSTGLADYLKACRITDVYLAGLATDYCVLYSALDAVSLGFKTHVIIDACRGVNSKAGDSDAAVERMRKAGVRILESRDVL
jgi:nicotinate phosphoribosyltransferase